MPLKNGRLTPKERIFVRTMVATHDPVYSATKAGYAMPEVNGYMKAAHPALKEHIREKTMARVTNDLLPKSVDLMEKILDDEKQNMKIRADIAKTVVRMELGPRSDSGLRKEPHEMTPGELEDEIERLRRLRSDMSHQVIEHEPTPSDGGVFG